MHQHSIGILINAINGIFALTVAVFCGPTGRTCITGGSVPVAIGLRRTSYQRRPHRSVHTALYAASSWCNTGQIPPARAIPFGGNARAGNSFCNSSGRNLAAIAFIAAMVRSYGER